jgi:hypothetical protein
MSAKGYPWDGMAWVIAGKNRKPRAKAEHKISASEASKAGMRLEAYQEQKHKHK